MAGCWFSIRDESGSIRVDTKAAGFVALDVPLHSQVTVQGTVAPDGDQRQVDATGIRY